MRVKFYIQGSEPGRQGTVHLEVREVWGPWWGHDSERTVTGSTGERNNTVKCFSFFRTQKVANMSFATYLWNLKPILEELLSLKIIEPKRIKRTSKRAVCWGLPRGVHAPLRPCRLTPRRWTKTGDSPAHESECGWVVACRQAELESFL